jgi:hypothetical protein
VQQIRVLTETISEDLIILPRPTEPGSGALGVHPWVAATGEHIAWDRVASGPGSTELRDAALAVVGALAGDWEKARTALRADPWQDTEFASRMSSRVRWLLATVLNPEKLQLSPAEAAILVIFPFLHAAFWARQAAERKAADPAVLGHRDSPGARAEFEQFIAGYGRLRRRGEHAATVGDVAGSGNIGWWLFHQWLARQADCYREESLAGLLAPQGSGQAERLIAEVFEPGRLMELFKNRVCHP